LPFCAIIEGNVRGNEDAPNMKSGRALS